MLASQIYQDAKENTNVTTVKDTKLNSNKGLKHHSKGFKDSTNTKDAGKNTSTVVSDCKFLSDVPKYLKKEKKTASVPKDSSTYGGQDEWSDIEDMHIYVEPEDDYEDILPKCERIQKADIDILFSIHPFQNYCELDVDQLPSPPPTLDIKDLFSDIFLPSPVIKCALYDDTIVEDIPKPDDPFLNLDDE